MQRSSSVLERKSNRKRTYVDAMGRLSLLPISARSAGHSSCGTTILSGMAVPRACQFGGFGNEIPENTRVFWSIGNCRQTVRRRTTDKFSTYNRTLRTSDS